MTVVQEALMELCHGHIPSGAARAELFCRQFSNRSS
jgi:hypothetical protein